MVLAWPLLLGLAVAPLLGGRWSRLADLRLRLPAVFYLAFVLQLIAFPFSTLPWRTPDRVGIVLWLVSYGLLAVGAACNMRLPGVPLVAVGMASNLAAILTNGGHMPALPSALRAAGLHFQQSRNSTRLSSPHLAWLVDRWATPHWVPLGNVFSAGDVLIAAGGVVFALAATGGWGGSASGPLAAPTAPSVRSFGGREAVGLPRGGGHLAQERRTDRCRRGGEDRADEERDVVAAVQRLDGAVP
jgi:uncharacterized protein DUF5317